MLSTEMRNWCADSGEIVKFIFIWVGLIIQITCKIRIINIERGENLWVTENFFYCRHLLIRNWRESKYFRFRLLIFGGWFFFREFFLLGKRASISGSKSDSKLWGPERELIGKSEAELGSLLKINVTELTRI